MKKNVIIVSISIAAIILILISTFIIYKNKKCYDTIETTEIFKNVVEENNLIEKQSEEDLENEENKNEDNKSEKANQETKAIQKTANATSSNIKKSNYDKKYYIKVNYTQNVVTIYEKDANGEYSIPIKAMICSTGTSTPKSGSYSIKSRWIWLKLFGNVWGHYVTQINGNILFHSVPYLKKEENTLEYWEYDKLGTSASMGCIRLRVIDSKWIYENIPSGTIVEFYSDSNPGPLGKPVAMKISGNETCRDWDPTDPNENNPWNKIQEVKSVQEETPIVQEDITISQESQTIEGNITQEEITEIIEENESIEKEEETNIIEEVIKENEDDTSENIEENEESEKYNEDESSQITENII